MDPFEEECLAAIKWTRSIVGYMQQPLKTSNSNGYKAEVRTKQ